MKPLIFASLLALPLTAQGALFQEDTALPPTVGVNIQAGFPQGEAGTDLNRNVGYGASVSRLFHLGGRHLLRLNLEYNHYRIPAPLPPVWASGIDQRPDFDTWKGGLDYLIYQEPWVFRGPYVLVGVGVQVSDSDYLVQNGTQQILSRHHASLTSPWAGAGIGYQFTSDIAVELRYSVAAYAAQKGQPLASYTLTESERRNGQYLHLVLALRVPI